MSNETKTPVQELAERLTEKGPEAIADELVKIATAARSLTGSRLSMDALTTLIQLNCPGRPAKDVIEKVLRAAATLDRAFVRTP